jgi:hypothetical protein
LISVPLGFVGYRSALAFIRARRHAVPRSGG